MKTKISEIEKKELLPGITGRYFHTKNNTIGFVELEAGAILPEHAHVHEQTTQIIEGQLEIVIDGKSQVLQEGMIVCIPPNVKHSAKALAFCKVTDIFSPTREDYK